MIRHIVENWEDERKAQEIQDIIEAMTVELKKDFREYSRKHRMTSHAEEHWESLIEDLHNCDFWEKMDHLLDFTFPFYCHKCCFKPFDEKF